MKDLVKLRAELLDLANDPIGMDDYKSQMRRYQIILLALIDNQIELVKALDQDLTDNQPLD